MQSYHTLLKEAIRLDKCPLSVTQQIPASNISRWKKEPAEKYFSGGLESIEKYTRLLESIQHRPGVFFAYARVIRSFNSIFQRSADFLNVLRAHKDEIVQVVLRVKALLATPKVLKVFGISPYTFKEWRLQVTRPCQSSAMKVCKKVHPTQLTQQEVNLMEKLLARPDKLHWPVSAICYWARRENLLFASLNTWYKYNKLLGWRTFAVKFRARKYFSLKAKYPNQYWHADVALFRTLDGAVSYIYTVVDNFSRKVLAWEVAEKLTATIRLQSIKQAYENALGQQQNLNVNLVMDGGPENNNHIIDRFIKNNQLTRLVALKDISFSNSMVEAVNKQLKYNSLFRKKMENFSALQKEVDSFFKEYNGERPHYALHGFTPDEVYNDQPLVSNPYQQQIREAVKKRMADNQQNYCWLCE